jgi:exonuclease III
VDFQLHRLQRLPSGRGIAAYYNNTCIINLNAPPGTANRAEREAFFNTELIDLIPHTPTDLIMAGDFNCVLSNLDCTGHRNSSRTLERLIQGLGLVDVWGASVNRQTYTHYAHTGAARLDRIYVTEDLRRQKQGMETIAAAFTDHLAVLLRMAMTTPFIHRGRGIWRMNISYLNDLPFKTR